ncbi:MAG: isoleucine--tRNA ligase [Alphaproteobacteria bacterium]|jgi:isoleucyl-tRNA synthetase|nr:isoleucine--tRNA ligase [Alphaproteobacteria bacterium]
MSAKQNSGSDGQTADYRPTLLLPKTDFPMKAGLAKREPEILARWQEMDLYGRQRQAAKGREKFILHDGPPYANGNIHMGTAMNKILKDVINRSQQMMGKDANYVPGWDCHGLPIEWKIEEKYRAAGQNKDEVPIGDFRRECRDFAEHWIGVQRQEFERLGVIGDWHNPYTTMTYAAEGRIVSELLKFLMDGSLYQGSKAVMWSVVEKTSLAEAEIEYHDHVSTTIFVRFKVRDEAPAEGCADLRGASIVIWTTTPWTMPGNRAIAARRDATYLRLRLGEVAEGSLAKVGEEIVVAEPLKDQVCAEAGITACEVVSRHPGREIVGLVCAHPLAGQGYDFSVPVLAAGFVEMDQGTGFVHIAPGHGADDFELGSAHGIEVPQTVDEAGCFYDPVPLFAGLHVFKADDPVCQALTAAGGLLGRGKISHSYPHSWRSKAPLIFRNAPQWFISMSQTGLRQTALAAIEATRFYPGSGQTRLYNMVEARPDWLISRQRAWGVPITVFVERHSDQPLRDEAVNGRIVEAVTAEGADAWFESPPERFLGPDYDPAAYDRVEDIVDVWFDSGCTHTWVLEDREDLEWPASLYLEGSDQHRGWFHSSLLQSCGSRGRAPYDGVLTHGFVMAADGRKMSKSLGNFVAPQDVIDQQGADILRLWVVNSDYSEDLRIGPEILTGQVDAYRRLRNTLRFLLANLAGFEAAEKLEPAAMPELERWVLHRLWELDSEVHEACGNFDFHRLFVDLYNFCVSDLSAFYFDIRKDALYCDRPDGPRRRGVRTVLDQVFTCVVTWLAPVLSFTCEQAWLSRYPDEAAATAALDSVHLQLFPELPPAWRDDAVAARWAKVREVRRVITGALEVERQEKRLGSSLQAHPLIFAEAQYHEAVADLDLAEIAITSGATLSTEAAPAEAFRLVDVPGIAVLPEAAAGAKCQRCWMVLPEVGKAQPTEPNDLCGRCADAVAAHRAGTAG